MLKSFRFIFRAVRNKRTELFISLVMVLVLLLMASVVMYFLERDAQPEAFSSVPATMWWGVATLTTVGYGDIYPITAYGKLLGGIIAILGVGLFALPAGIIASGFVEEIENDKLSKLLKLQEKRLKHAFSVEYYVPVYNKKKVLGMGHIPRKWLSLSDIKYKIGIQENEVLEVVDGSGLFRLRNVRLKDGNVPGLEFINVGNSYGQCIQRQSNLTVVNLYASIQPFFGHFSFALADCLGASYISNEVFSKLSFHEEKQLNMIQNDGYTKGNPHPAIKDIAADFKKIINKGSTCIFIVNATSDEHLLQFNIGGEEGDDTFDNGVFFKEKELLNQVFLSAEKMAEKYEMKILRHEKFGMPPSDHVAWYIHEKTQCNLILLHVNVGILKKKGSEYYQYIHDISQSLSLLKKESVS